MLEIISQEGVSAVALYGLYLIMPGYLVVRLSGLPVRWFLPSFGISLAVLVLTQVPFLVLGGTVLHWCVLLHVTYLALFVFAFLAGKRKPIIMDSGEESRSRESTQSERIAYFFWVLVLALFASYHIIIGPYTEIPSDFWAHLGHVKNEMRIVSDGNFISVGSLSRAFSDGAFVPYLHAAAAAVLGKSPLELVAVVTLVSSCIFVSGVYWFAVYVSETLRLGVKAKIAAAVLTVAFFVLAYGVSAFAYVRYYAYMPHMLNMVIMFGTIMLFSQYLRNEQYGWATLSLIGTMVLLMLFVNHQEALFVIVLLAGICVVGSFRIYAGDQEFSIASRRRYVTFTALSLVGAVVTIVFTFVFLPIGKMVTPHIIDLGNILPFTRSLPIANPTLRFWQSIAVFGFLVYLWFGFRIRWFLNSDYVMAAMLSPLATLLNPVFVWWFLHVASWDPLWRLAYLVPIPLVAGILVVKEVVMGWHKDKWRGILLPITLSGLVMLTLTSFNTRYVFNDNPRWASLQALNASNGAELWGDLVSFVQKLPGEELRLITDNVTNYVLATGTPHGVTSGAKSRWQTKENPFYGDFKDRLLYWRNDGIILIINYRDGEKSETGRISRHWPSDILLVSRQYPPDLKSFVDSRPDDFKLLWQADKIWVYRLTRDPNHYN